MRLVPAGPAAFALALALALPARAPAADYGSGVSVKVVLKTTVTASGEKFRYPVTDRAEVTASEVEIAPGADTGLHRHPGPVLAWVVSGTLSVDVAGGETKTYTAGQPIVEVVGLDHVGKNRGTVPVRLLVFYLGAEGAPLTVKEGSP